MGSRLTGGRLNKYIIVRRKSTLGREYEYYSRDREARPGEVLVDSFTATPRDYGKFSISRGSPAIHWTDWCKTERGKQLAHLWKKYVRETDWSSPTAAPEAKNSNDPPWRRVKGQDY